MSDQRLKAYIERILRCRQAEDEAKDDTKSVYAEAHGDGYEKSIIGQVVSHIRKRDKDGDKVAEQSAKFDLYLEAYDRPSHAHTREGNEYAAAKGAATDEPTTATDVVGDFLREPAAVVPGQIIREGDAPRETNRTSGDASRPDTEFPLPASSSQQADRAEADTLLPSASATLSPAAQSPTGAGGHLSEPSPDAGAGQQAADADHRNAKSGQAANSISDADVPAFLLKKAMAENEAA